MLEGVKSIFFATAKEKDVSSRHDYQNQHVISTNKLPGHSPPQCFASEKEALCGRLEEEDQLRTTNCIILSDPSKKWDFNFSETPSKCPPVMQEHGGFFIKGDEFYKWTTISVPSNWECEGFGQAVYTNFQYPFKVDPPYIPDGMNHVGSYQTTFEMPPEWKDKRIFISFEGVSASFYLFLNGRKVGYSQDSRLPAEFDITTFCRPGANAVSVRVFRFCDGSYLEDQDQWWLSGIYRDVRIYAKPSKLLLWDHTVVTTLDPADPTAATLRIDAVVLAPDPAAHPAAELEAGCRVRASLYGPHRLLPGCTHADPPPDTPAVFRGVELARGAAGAAEGGAWQCGLSLERRVTGVRAWSAEDPWLYTLVVTLDDGAGGAAECEASRVGFRTVWVEGNRMLVNGAAALMCGVNRHEHDMRRGKYTSREDMVRDIELMKQFNFNAVRACHYPNRTLWYRLCDAYGLYVVDEANVETHGLALEGAEDALLRDPSWEASYVDRGVRMVARDKNHACIISWSLGNEAAYGPHLATMAARIRALDPTRPVQYESCGGAPATDVVCPMYPSVDRLRRLATLAEQNRPNWEIGRTWPRGTAREARPVIMCEYAHAMGNSSGNLDEYWDLIRATPGLQGGFIWDWIDQGLVRTGPDGKEIVVYGGGFGESVHDANFMVNGLVFPDRTPHPGMHQVKKVYAPAAVSPSWPRPPAFGPGGVLVGDAAVRVLNRHDFAGLERFRLEWRLDADGAQLLAGAADIPAGFGPGATWELPLPLRVPPAALPAGAAGRREVVLTASLVLAAETPWAPAGHEVAWGQAALPAPPAPAPAPSAGPGGAAGAVRVEEGREGVVAEGDGWRMEFCRRRGGLVSMRVRGRELLAPAVEGGEGVLVANVWRCPTDNDLGGIDTVIGTKLPQRWTKESGNGDGAPRVRGPLAFMLKWCLFWGDVSHAHRWRSAGLDRLAPRAVSAAVSRRADGAAVITFRYTLRPPPARRVGWLPAAFEPDDGARETATWRLPPVQSDGRATAIPCETVYTVLPSGEVVVTNTCTVGAGLPPPPRVGVRLGMGPGFRRVAWYGRGPHESYPDRRTGAKLGRHACRVEETDVPYMFPSENGNFSDTRWAAVTDDAGVGLLFAPAAGDETLHFSAHDYTALDLHRAMNAYEVKRREDGTFVTLDARHMGLGGNDSWSRAILPEYLVAQGTYRHSVLIRPVQSAEEIGRPALPADPDGAFAFSYRRPPALSVAWHGALGAAYQAMAVAPLKITETFVSLKMEALQPRVAVPAVAVLAVLVAWIVSSLRAVN